MKIIDRYILGKFLSTFFFCLLMMTLVVVVIDWSEHADDFVKSRLSFLRILTEYYAGFIPHLDAMLFPLFVFISVIFFTAKMADRTEVVAVLSSGVSFSRFLLPYWIGGILLSGTLWIGYQNVLPKANAIWSDFELRYISGSLNYATTAFPKNFYFRLDSNSYAGIRYFDTTSKSGGVFFIQRFRNNELVYNLRAESISWDTTTRAWQLNRVLERRLNNETETITTSPLKKVTYNFQPRDLRKDEYLKERLSTRELNDLIRLEQIRGKEGINSLLVERYNRDAIPVSVLILTIIGATIASRKVRGGSGFHLAMGVLLSVTYILCSRFSIVFATKGNFHPLIAAWLPNIIFGILALFLYRRAAT